MMHNIPEHTQQGACHVRLAMKSNITLNISVSIYYFHKLQSVESFYLLCISYTLDDTRNTPTYNVYINVVASLITPKMVKI